MIVDKPYVSRAKGQARQTLHRVKRVLQARRNGVLSFFGVFLKGRSLQVSTRNTRPDGITVSRAFIIGPRGGLSSFRKGKRRYLKAREIGRGRK